MDGCQVLCPSRIYIHWVCIAECWNADCPNLTPLLKFIYRFVVVVVWWTKWKNIPVCRLIRHIQGVPVYLSPIYSVSSSRIYAQICVDKSWEPAGYAGGPVDVADLVDNPHLMHISFRRIHLVFPISEDDYRLNPATYPQKNRVIHRFYLVIHRLRG
jgi:hypothetical protein